MQDYTREQQCFTKENLYTEFILGGGGPMNTNTKEENARSS